MWEVIFCISWVYFSTMQYHSLRRFPVPLVSTGIYIPESVCQTLKVSSIGFPLGKVVRGGESERGSNGTILEEGPRNIGPILAPF